MHKTILNIVGLMALLGGVCFPLMRAGASRPAGRPAAQMASPVYYHDQSGTSLYGSAAETARRASERIGFTVHLPHLVPAKSALQAVWVMEHHAPRFIVAYYGSANEPISAQLHESIAETPPALHWARPKAITVARGSGLLYQLTIGGPHPAEELVWHRGGVRYDLVGSTAVPLRRLLLIASSL